MGGKKSAKQIVLKCMQFITVQKYIGAKRIIFLLSFYNYLPVNVEIDVNEKHQHM